MPSKITNEKNIQILINLLKQHNIKDVIANPGTTNINFVASIQNDSFFKLHSCVDERSSAYMACGIAAETGNPVVLTCTGATASRNYIPGLTEAFYRKLPIIAVTATQHLGRIGQNIAQVLDRSVQLNDMVKTSVTLPSVYTDEDHWACNLMVNSAILECQKNGGGPVHINVVTNYSNTFTAEKLPDERVIHRITSADTLPEITSDKIAIFIGEHRVIAPELETEIDTFCEKYNGVVLCDHTSNYNGKYKILANLVCGQPSAQSNELSKINLVIDMGNISGAYMQIKPSEVWRVNEDGIIRDTYRKLTHIFQMREIDFFEKYNSKITNRINTTYYEQWHKCDEKLRAEIDHEKIPFSNIWVAQELSKHITQDDILHFGILNTLRSWNFTKIPNNIECHCNTGGFGIDGIMSTAIGNSLCTPKTVYCLIGDLAFFYDFNSLGNKEIKNNLRILLINNGCGTEFHNYNHRAAVISNEQQLSPEYFAADGHFGNKSKELVKHYSEDLGFDYITASNKAEFKKNIAKFTKKENKKPIIFEVFTNSHDESSALQQIMTIDQDISSMAKKLIGKKGISVVKKILGK